MPVLCGMFAFSCLAFTMRRYVQQLTLITEEAFTHLPHAQKTWVRFPTGKLKSTQLSIHQESIKGGLAFYLEKEGLASLRCSNSIASY